MPSGATGCLYGASGHGYADPVTAGGRRLRFGGVSSHNQVVLYGVEKRLHPGIALQESTGTRHAHEGMVAVVEFTEDLRQRSSRGVEAGKYRLRDFGCHFVDSPRNFGRRVRRPRHCWGSASSFWARRSVAPHSHTQG
jgi:hypothetical protein